MIEWFMNGFWFALYALAFGCGFAAFTASVVFICWLMSEIDDKVRGR